LEPDLLASKQVDSASIIRPSIVLVLAWGSRRFARMEREEWRKKVEGVSLLLGEKTAEDDDEDEGDWDKRSRDIYLARGKTRTRTNEEPTHSPSWLALPYRPGRT
jgi:hypothetical protein